MNHLHGAYILYIVKYLKSCSLQTSRGVLLSDYSKFFKLEISSFSILISKFQYHDIPKGNFVVQQQCGAPGLIIFPVQPGAKYFYSNLPKFALFTFHQSANNTISFTFIWDFCYSFRTKTEFIETDRNRAFSRVQL